MANVTPGSAAKLNKLVGYAQMIPVTQAELEGDAGSKKMKPNVLLVLPDGKVVKTDGVTAVKDLPILIDQPLTLVEKTALSAAFDGDGNYQAVEGGVVLHGADGKIADTEFNFIDENGLILLKYLASIVEDGKIKLDVLPDSVKAGIHYFANYAAMAASTDADAKRGICIILDASDDPSGTVTKGAASYGWKVIPAEEEGGEDTGEWMKIAEVESLDIDISALEPTYENVQAAGAVMYDHPIELGGMTLSDLAALEAAVVTEPED